MFGNTCICPSGPMPGHYEGCPLTGDLAGIPVPIRPEGIITHRRNQCDETTCCIHNPSPHPMRAWPLFIRLDKLALAERICLHGVGHPDPDSVAFIRRRTTQSIGDAMLVHGCDGCCHGAYQ